MQIAELNWVMSLAVIVSFLLTFVPVNITVARQNHYIMISYFFTMALRLKVVMGFFLLGAYVELLLGIVVGLVLEMITMLKIVHNVESREVLA